NCQLDKTVIGYSAPTSALCKVNDRAITGLVKHALLYIIGLPVSTATEANQVEICVDLEVTDNQLLVTLNARGFVTSDQIRQVIQQPTSLYSDLLTHPLLFNYYVAYKEAMMLSADLQVQFLTTSHQIIGIS